MKAKILIFLLCLASLSVMGQNDNTQGTISRAKCKICGKVISQCKYKGKHPAPQPERTCDTCGKVVSKCQYKGKHPKPKPTPTPKPTPEAAGYDVTFSCNVSSASLYIDGNANGSASGTRFLKTGSHSIRVTANGYEDYSRSITVNRQNTSFNITLNKKTEPAKPVVATSGTLNGHEWVDLGLSVKWATCNVGADSPSDYGGYYAWGETSTKSSYEWSNCFDCLDSTGDSWGTYKLGGQTRITPTSGHDTARENWGGTWRMPTRLEIDELCERCEWTWTSKQGHKGYIVKGPNGNSIFIPAAGHIFDSVCNFVGDLGYYLSSSLSTSISFRSISIIFNEEGIHAVGSTDRKDGQSVRPVTE